MLLKKYSSAQMIQNMLEIILQILLRHKNKYKQCKWYRPILFYKRQKSSRNYSGVFEDEL